MNKELILNKIKTHYNFKDDSEFARFLGIKPQTLYNWKKRDSFDIPLVYTKCVNISAEWLITGEGEMLKSENVEKNISENIAAEPDVLYDADEWKNKYEQLNEKYTALLEQHNALLTNKLKEVLKDKSVV